MELNREQIIQICEHCIEKECERCLLYEEADYCIDILAPNIIALIKELTEKIDDLEYRLEVQGDNLGATREWLNDAECKVEKLNAENEDLKAIAEQYQKQFENAKADTVREFAERVKAKTNAIREKRDMVLFPFTEVVLFAIEKEIDQIAKEMLED